MLAALMMIATAAIPNVIATFNDPHAVAEGIVAEQIARPARVPADIYAAELVKAEGLTSWSVEDPTGSPPDAPLAWKARHAADGREVTVYFAPSGKSVCRIRRPRGGLSDAHHAAVRWCAASLGIALPATPSPPVG
ncbi:MAG: hypothetical protein ABW184_12850 [Sphingobium sp.]